MNLTIHRGSKEIGGSCVEIATTSTRIVVDIGIPLIDKDGSAFDIKKYAKLNINELNSKGILPAVKGLFAGETKQIDAVIISHPHIDHYGFLNYVNKDIPVFVGRAARKLIELTATFTSKPTLVNKFRHFDKEVKLIIGDFVITPYWNDHSGFDAYSFLIQNNGQRIFYSGDFRSHGRKEKVFKWFKHNAPKDVDILLMEGTTLGRSSPSEKSESELERDFVNVFNQKKISLVYTSGQNIDRLVTIYRACLRTKKTLVVDVYIANVLKDISAYAKTPFPSTGFPYLKVLFPYYLSKRLADSGKGNLLYRFRKYKITKEEISSKPADYVLTVRPSMITDLKRIQGLCDGNFIYSMWDGYLKDEKTKKFTDHFKVDLGFEFHKIHSSGHADLKALKEMVNAVRPKELVPIHTFEPQKYKQLFNVPVRFLKDGEVYTI